MTNEEKAADELEALNAKYHSHVTVLRLASGRYALFDRYSNTSGRPLVAIGTWSELEPHIPQITHVEPTYDPISFEPRVKRRTPTTDDLMEGL